MTYDADEKSTEDSSPVELYTITTPAATYYLTSHGIDYPWSGHTYLATVISRANIVATGLGKSREIVLTIAAAHALTQYILATANIPPRDISCSIVRVQAGGASQRLWDGFVTGHGARGELAQLRVPSKTDDAFAVKLPIAAVQRSCNNVLYDTMCKVSQSGDVVETTTVVSVSGTTIVLTSVGARADQWAKFGRLDRSLDVERRSVLSQIGTTITVDVPFRSLAAGDQVSLYAGCDHLVETCRDDFNNVVNFSGDPLLPTYNPWNIFGLGARK